MVSVTVSHCMRSSVVLPARHRGECRNGKRRIAERSGEAKQSLQIFLIWVASSSHLSAILVLLHVERNKELDMIVERPAFETHAR
jgi:hypothetical protein